MTYTAEFDTVDAGQWHQLLLEFADANIFQTWLYGAAHWGEGNLSHAVVRKDGEVIGLAQAVLVGAPLLGKILAYVIFGPVYQRRGADNRIEDLKATIAALRAEYAVRRRLCLRLRFWVYDVSDDVYGAVLAEGGWKEARPLHRTYILDLSRSESQLRAALDKKWRANLRKAEQCGLVVAQRNDQAGIRMFLDLHRQMRERKRFVTMFTAMLPDLYRKLPDGLRPHLFVCWQDGVPIAAAIVSALGHRAFSLNAATGDGALAVRAGYLLQWTIVRWLKASGQCRWYDLCVGTSTPGVRQFKRGLAGARAPEIVMTELAACPDRLSALIVGAASRLHELRRKLRGPWARFKSRMPVRDRGPVPEAPAAPDARSRARASR
jgi:Acetyltransferase (GNAT) domain